jgi:hypothetical protein
VRINRRRKKKEDRRREQNNRLAALHPYHWTASSGVVISGSVLTRMAGCRLVQWRPAKGLLSDNRPRVVVSGAWVTHTTKYSGGGGGGGVFFPRLF